MSKKRVRAKRKKADIIESVLVALESTQEELEKSAAQLRQNAERAKQSQREMLSRPAPEEQLQALSKTVLEYLRNFLVVCALAYAASKTSNIFVQIVAWLAKLAFIALTVSYFISHVDIFLTDVQRKWLRLMLFIVGFIATYIALNAIVILINNVVDEMVRSQDR